MRCDDLLCLDEETSVVDELFDSLRPLSISLVLDSAGFPVIAYEEPVTLDTGEASPQGRLRLALDAAGIPVIAYVADLGLAVLTCSDEDCIDGGTTTESIETDTNVRALSLSLDAAGFPAVAYYAAVGGNLNFVRCNDRACAGGDDTPVVVDAGEQAGRRPSLALDAVGLPVLVYSTVDTLLAGAMCRQMPRPWSSTSR